MNAPGGISPIAEETGLIVPLGEWVLRHACRQMRAWQISLGLPCDGEGATLGMSVNVSSKQFSQGDLGERVAAILLQTELAAQCLKLEITESVLMENAESAALLLRRFKEMNIQLLMDDFGTGYSSLSYLHRFPVDVLKIDRSFISNLGSEKGSREIVRTIMGMASGFEMNTVAEGIETDTQRCSLRALGCPFGQGYFFSRPLDAGPAGDFIQKNLAENPL
jgi:EAL domain-containing protein (putative c-di-GMP-specific phosphodiesterase class I)